MPFSLRNLIKASGFAGVAGQSFRNHVSGAVGGTRMSDYIIPKFVLDTGSVSVPPFTYGTTATLTLPFTLPNKGIRASAIQRRAVTQFGANRFPVNGNFGGSSVTITSLGTWSDDNKSGSLNLTVVAPFAGTPTLTTSASFFTNGAGSTPSDTPQRVRWQAKLSSTPAGTSSLEITTRYTPDIGPFNDTLFSSGSGPNDGFIISVTNRAYEVDDYEYEWHSNSGYSDLLSNSSFYIPTFGSAIYTRGGTYTAPYDDASYGGSVLTAYLRWRSDSGSGWNNVGAVTFTDPRTPAVH